MIFACIALLPLLGCGADDGIGQRYSVSGKVTYKGELVKAGNVNFSPDDAGVSGRGATGVIKEGYYSMTTLTPGDGVLPGKYKVGINANYTDMSKAVNKPGGIYSGNLYAGPRIKVIPEKYTNPATSGLTFEVKTTSKLSTSTSQKLVMRRMLPRLASSRQDQDEAKAKEIGNRFAD